MPYILEAETELDTGGVVFEPTDPVTWGDLMKVSLKTTLNGIWVGDSLWDAPASVFTAGTYAWAAYGTNTIANDANSLKITYDNNALGAFVNFSDAADLSSNLTIGNHYRFTCDAKVGAGDSVGIRINYNGGSGDEYTDIITVTSTTFVPVVITFTAKATTQSYVQMSNMSAGEIIWLDNLALRQYN